MESPKFLIYRFVSFTSQLLHHPAFTRFIKVRWMEVWMSDISEGASWVHSGPPNLCKTWYKSLTKWLNISSFHFLLHVAALCLFSSVIFLILVWCRWVTEWIRISFKWYQCLFSQNFVDFVSSLWVAGLLQWTGKKNKNICFSFHN